MTNTRERFYAVGDQLIGQNVECMCGDGTQAARVMCDVCNGTGRGARGGYGGCKRCHGMRTYYALHKRETCRRCNGTVIDNFTPSLCDTAPQYLLDQIPWEVVRSERRLTFGEQYLGAGLYSCTDYGEHKSLTDSELIARARNSGACSYLQAIKIANKQGELAQKIVILCADYGYSVVAIGKDGKGIY